MIPWLRPVLLQISVFFAGVIFAGCAILFFMSGSSLPETLSLQIGGTGISVYFLAKTAITLIVLFLVAGMLARFGERRIKETARIRTGHKALLVKALQIFIYFTAFIIGMDILDIDLTALAVFGGAAGIGIGFGLQKITSNFMSGLILLFEKSIENDDLIELADGTCGFIRHTGARYILIETFDGKEIMIPNEDFISSRVTNWTYSNKKCRIEIKTGISYSSPVEKAMKIMLETAREHPRSVNDPEPVCFLREFGESSINFLLFFWVADVTEGRYNAQSDVMLSIWKKFSENGIAVPFPQRDLHIFKTEKEE